MRLKAASILICLSLIPLLVFAQRDCGDGLPCGKLPWDLPLLPELNTPTPIPTINITAVSTAAPAPTSVVPPSPAPTGTIQADFTGLGDQLATLGAVVNATAIPVEISGTPVDTGEQLAGIGDDAGTFFGYVRGFSEASLGGLTPFTSFAILSVVVIIGIKALAWILPVGAVIFRLILRIVEVVKQLIGI